jgi:hypothetical protein
MAESTLSVTKADMDSALGGFLGFTEDSTNWSSDESGRIDKYRKAGQRQAYYPPIVQGMKFPYKWRFLRPVYTLTAWADVAVAVVGTPSHAAGFSTIDVADDTFYATMVGASVLFDTSGDSYVVSEYVTAQQIKVVGDASGETAADMIVMECGNYQMPDDFGTIDGRLTFAPAVTCRDPLPVVGEAQIRELRQRDTSSGVPVYAALRPKTIVATAGQRWEMLLHPRPDTGYALTFRYHVLLNDLVNSTDYPPGGMVHGDMIIASCLAAAEQGEEDAKGPKWQDFMTKLVASIAVDLRGGPEFLGRMTDGSDESGARGVQHAGLPIVSYNGVVQ